MTTQTPSNEEIATNEDTTSKIENLDVAQGEETRAKLPRRDSKLLGMAQSILEVSVEGCVRVYALKYYVSTGIL